MKIITASILGIVFLFVVSFLFLKSSEASPNLNSTTAQSTPLANKETKETPSPTPADIPATIDGIVQENLDPPIEFPISRIFDAVVGSSDVDCDGVPNSEDNCVLAYNPGQRDRNKNGIGDVCEGKAAKRKDFRCDTDKDGVLDRNDNCILVCNPDQTDKNKNGFGDVCDPALLKDWVHINPCTKQQHKRIRQK